MRISCDCHVCQGACKHKPGWFLPGEAEKVATYMGITLPELFKQYLGVDYWVGEQSVFVLSPAVTSMRTGTVFRFDPTGRCVFYGDDGRCKIHPVAPHECQMYHHDEPKEDADKRHEMVAESWKPEQTQIAELLGYEPEEPEGSFFDLLSL